MATFSRNVTVNWEGSIMEGKGTAKAGSGAFNLPISFPRRIGDAEGVTSPEELIAAAHASCFAMALNARSAKEARQTDVTAVTATRGRRHQDHVVELGVVAHGLTGSRRRVPEVAPRPKARRPGSRSYHAARCLSGSVTPSCLATLGPDAGCELR
jgi:osmotically inducible protein OsmC